MADTFTCKVDLSVLAYPPKHMTIIAFFKHMFEYTLDDINRRASHDITNLVNGDLYNLRQCHLYKFMYGLKCNPVIQVKDVLDYMDELVYRGLYSEDDVASAVCSVGAFAQHVNLTTECIDQILKHDEDEDGDYDYWKGVTIVNARIYANATSDLERIFIQEYFMRGTMRNSWYNRGDESREIPCNNTDNIVTFEEIRQCTYEDAKRQHDCTINDFNRIVINMIYKTLYRLHLSPLVEWSYLESLNLNDTELERYNNIVDDMLRSSPKLTNDIVCNSKRFKRYFNSGHYIPNVYNLCRVMSYENIFREYSTHGFKSCNKITYCHNITFGLICFFNAISM